MDRFGFNRVAGNIKQVQRNFIEKGIELAREEMIKNVVSQTSSESGKSYPALTYLIDWVPKNPPRLVLTGELFEEILHNRPHIVGNKGTLTIDPIDERGKGYASYHQEGENQYKNKDDFQSEFVTQSKELENKQVNLLLSELNRIFN